MSSPITVIIASVAAVSAVLGAVSAATARAGGRNRYTEIGLAQAARSRSV